MIIVFGSVNLDLIFPLPHLPAAGETVLGPDMTIEPGGKGANQAVAAAQDGASVIFAGAVGTDSLADDALRLMRATHIDLTRLAAVDASTGCAAICVDPDGRNLISVASGANLHAREAQIEDGLLHAGTTLLLQMEVPSVEIERLVRRARQTGCRIILNLAPAASIDHSVLRALDVLVVNEGEAAFLARQCGCAADAEALRAHVGCANVVVTLGERGLEAATPDGPVILPAREIEVVDTTGAGDCFTGVLASALDRGIRMGQALVRATAAAGLCCASRGTQGSMPTAVETDAALS